LPGALKKFGRLADKYYVASVMRTTGATGGGNAWPLTLNNGNRIQSVGHSKTRH